MLTLSVFFFFSSCKILNNIIMLVGLQIFLYEFCCYKLLLSYISYLLYHLTFVLVLALETCLAIYFFLCFTLAVIYEIHHKFST